MSLEATDYWSVAQGIVEKALLDEKLYIMVDGVEYKADIVAFEESGKITIYKGKDGE